MRSWLGFLRRVVGRSGGRDAYREESKAVLAALARPLVDPRLNEDANRLRQSGDASVVELGTALADPNAGIAVSLKSLPGRTHALLYGAAGCGKSYLLGGMC